MNGWPPGDVATPAGARQAADFMIADIHKCTPKHRPAFLHVFLGNGLTALEVLELVQKGLGPK